MSIDYLRNNKIILSSDILQRDLSIDEVPELNDHELLRFIAEAEVTIKCLLEDHRDLDDDDQGRVHVRHKRSIWKDYRQAALIEQKLRGIDAQERFFDLVAKRLGFEEAQALMTAAKG